MDEFDGNKIFIIFALIYQHFIDYFLKTIQECSVRIERLEIYNDKVVQPDEKENANTLSEINENNGQINEVPAKRYRTRSSVSGLSVANDTNGQIQRKPPTEPKPKPQFIDYKGKVEYYTEFHDIAFASDTLL